MNKLTKAEVLNEINRLVDYGELELTSKQINTTIDIFNRSMKENRNKNKTRSEQLSLVGDIAIGLSYNETPEQLFRAHSDNRHMAYFDNFLGEGEADAIIDALHKHGISTEIFRGLKKGIEDIYEVGNVKVSQYVESIDGGSPEIVEFIIEVGGQEIYRWSKRVSDDINERLEKLAEESTKYDIPLRIPPTKSGKPRKSIYLATEYSSSGERLILEEMSNGKIAFRDVKTGRFAKR